MRVIVLLISMGLLSACDSLGLGADSYGCKGMPEGVRCMSARQVYSLTDDRESLDQATFETLDGRKVETKNVPSENKTPDAASTARVQDAALPAQSLGNPVNTGQPAAWIDDGRVPVRTPASVMRVWVASWETPNGDLMMPSLIYTEITPRRWSVGLPPTASREVLQPLAASTAPPKGVSAKQ